MNEYEIEGAACLFQQDSTPNLARGAQVLVRLKDWTNAHSDGWPYWQKPRQASAKLQALLEDARRRGYAGDYADCPGPELAKALTPIRSFLTRQGVDHALVFG